MENRDSKGVEKDKSMLECLVIKCVGHQAFPDGASGKESACQSKRHGFDPWVGKIDPLKEGMVTHSSSLIWRIPMEKPPGGLQSIGLQRVKHN